MKPSSSQDLYEYSLELRKLAYTMPGGCEDPLIRLSERMAQTASHDDRGTASPASRPAERKAAAAGR